jgi:phosphatidylserine/phosphatidylglycerophosphate/cardiolipin synthase-like enzyme
LDLIVLPDDGATPILKAVEEARESLDLVIFRFDLKPLEKAIEAAQGRGVAVRALVAHTNRGGDKRLRQLEQRMLDAGVTVTRTPDDLVRYHGKMMIVDRSALYVLGYNYTTIDINSRSFGLICRDRRTVLEAIRLFDADTSRQEFEPEVPGFVVSPENAREELATFIKRTKKSLVIWDPQVADPQMIRLLTQRHKAGVDIRIIGKLSKRGSDLRVQKMPGGDRLHVRAMVRDGDAGFVGSQSLRQLELDGRREVGLIFKDAKAVKTLVDTFEKDWARTELGQKELKAGGKELSLAEAG